MPPQRPNPPVLTAGMNSVALGWGTMLMFSCFFRRILFQASFGEKAPSLLAQVRHPSIVKHRALEFESGALLLARRLVVC